MKFEPTNVYLVPVNIEVLSVLLKRAFYIACFACCGLQLQRQCIRLLKSGQCINSLAEKLAAAAPPQNLLNHHSIIHDTAGYEFCVTWLHCCNNEYTFYVMMSMTFYQSSSDYSWTLITYNSKRVWLLVFKTLRTVKEHTIEQKNIILTI